MKKLTNILKSGFTLIELLIAVSIIIILTTAAVTSYTTANKSSRDAKRKADLEALRSSLELFRSQNQKYVAGISNNWVDVATQLPALETGNYIDNLPSDPKSTPYLYKPTDSDAIGNHYGYCLGAVVEIIPTISVPSACGTGATGYNYYLKNP